MALFVLVCVVTLQLSYFHYGVESKEEHMFFRKDYAFVRDLESFYKVHTTEKNWWNAKRRCQMEGAQLFFPEDKAEADTVNAVVKQLHPGYAWMLIGVNDLLAEGEFQTIDGRPIDEVYHEWGAGEPNDRFEIEDCVILRENGKLNDETCYNRYPFVCKKTQASLEWNVFCDIPDTSYSYNNELGKCYKFHTRPLNWTEAFSVCAAEQSYLAVIDGQAEADYLVKMTADARKDKVRGNFLRGSVHLGFTVQDEGEGFVTVKGVPLEDNGYHVWDSQQPDNMGGNELCGAMSYNGRLNDVNCTDVSFFICEHDIGLLSSSFDDRFGTSSN